MSAMGTCVGCGEWLQVDADGVICGHIAGHALPETSWRTLIPRDVEACSGSRRPPYDADHVHDLSSVVEAHDGTELAACSECEYVEELL